MTPLDRAKQALSSAGFLVGDTDDGRVSVRWERATGKERSCGTIWQQGSRITGNIRERISFVAEALGDAGIRLEGQLATVYGRRQTDTIGFVRQQPDGSWWGATGLGGNTMERATGCETQAEALEILADSGAVAIVPLRDGETGWDGLDRLLEHLREANLLAKTAGGQRRRHQ